MGLIGLNIAFTPFDQGYRVVAGHLFDRLVRLIFKAIQTTFQVTNIGYMS